MRILRISRRTISKEALAEALSVLKKGGVVAYPTDTAYGLAADPRNRKAMRLIYAIKGREKGKPLPLIAGSFRQAAAFIRLGRPQSALARRHWPGPLTIVAARRAGRGTAAVRVPASSVARSLANALGRPVTSTSANISGRPPLYSGTAVRREFSDRRRTPDLLLDAGPLPMRPVSTIVRVQNGKIEVLRQGPVKL
jgi:L-threonylcarbamoyladenylate synthase